MFHLFAQKHSVVFRSYGFPQSEDYISQGALLMAFEVVMTQVAWSHTSPGNSKLLFFSLAFEPQASLIRVFTILSGLVWLNHFQITPVMFWK